MKTKNIIIVLFAIVMLIKTQPVMAQVAGEVGKDWTLLGSHKVDHLIDHDEVDLQGNSESISALKFVIKGGTVNMHRCSIHYADGQTTDVDFDGEDGPGSLVIDLKGESKAVEKITFWYDTDRKSDNRATLEVWGKKTNKK